MCSRYAITLKFGAVVCLDTRRVSLLATTYAATAPVPASIKIPRSLREVDNGKILGFGADLAADHPVKLDHF